MMTGGAWTKDKFFYSSKNDWTNLSDHHSPVREGQVHHKHIRRSSEGLDLEENVDHTPIAKEADDEQKEIGNPYQVIGQGVLRRELSPVLIHNLQSSPVQPIQLAGSLDQDILINILFS